MRRLFLPVEVLCSFADQDTLLLEQLERHLKVLQREGQIIIWHKRQITAGSDWQNELDTYLNTATLILLLISPDFLASDYLYGVELQRAVQRHDSNEARVIPIVLRPCDWENGPLARLQKIPRNGKAVTSWHNYDEAFTEIVKEIRTTLADIQQLTSSLPPTAHSRIWNIPYRRNPHFTGRDELLKRVNEQFSLETQVFTLCMAAPSPPKNVNKTVYPLTNTSIDGA